MRQRYRIFLIISLCISITLSSNSLVLAEASHEALKTEDVTESSQLSERLVRMIFGIIVLEFFYVTAHPKVQKTFLKQCEPQALFANFLQEYGKHFIVNAFHEFGHAFAAHHLNNDPIDIHLGSNSSDPHSSTPLLKTEHLTIDGFDPMSGHTYYKTPINLSATLATLAANYCHENHLDPSTLTSDEIVDIFNRVNKSADKRLLQQSLVTDKYKLAGIVLAGGIVGLATNGIIKVLNSLATKEHPPLSDMCKEAFGLDQIAIQQLFNLLVPFQVGKTSRSDAAVFYSECCDVPERPLKAISKASPYARILSTIMLELKRNKHSSKASDFNKVLIGIANYFLEGFFTFHA